MLFGRSSKIIDATTVVEIMGLDEFIEFNNTINSDCCLENNTKKFRRTDDEVKKIMRELCNCDTVEAFLKFDVDERIIHIKKLKEEGVSIRQLSRLTGISKGIVERI